MLSLTQLIANFAASCNPAPGSGGNILGFPTWYEYLPGREDPSGRCIPQVEIPDGLIPILLAVFEILLRVGGLVAIGFIIFAGFQLILAQGESERVKGARSTLVNALIGLTITIFATAIVNVIARNIG